MPFGAIVPGFGCSAGFFAAAFFCCPLPCCPLRPPPTVSGCAPVFMVSAIRFRSRSTLSTVTRTFWPTLPTSCGSLTKRAASCETCTRPSRLRLQCRLLCSCLLLLPPALLPLATATHRFGLRPGLHGQRDPVPLEVDAQHGDAHLLADLDDVVWIPDEAVREL